jgi:hypothetical protein
LTRPGRVSFRRLGRTLTTMADRRRGQWLGALALVIMSAGAVTIVAGQHAPRWSPPPVPPAWAAGTGPARVIRSDSGYRPRRMQPLPRSMPLSVTIPKIHVRARIIPLGLNIGGAVEVPSLTTPFLTSWFDKGPSPGQRGSAAVFGHVDSRIVGPAVFYDLGNLRPGNRIYVTLSDKTVAIFKVYSVAIFPKANFPTAQVYQNNSWPTLKLITCGGAFDNLTGHYLSNIVVSASYIGHKST